MKILNCILLVLVATGVFPNANATPSEQVLDALNSMTRSYEQQLETLTEKNSSLEKTVKALQDSSKTSKEEMSRASANKVELETQLSSTKEQLAASIKEVTQQTKTVSQLQKELDSTKNSLVSAEKFRDEAKSNDVQAKAELKSERTARTKLDQQVAAIEKVVAAKDAEIKTLTNRKPMAQDNKAAVPDSGNAIIGQGSPETTGAVETVSKAVEQKASEIQTTPLKTNVLEQVDQSIPQAAVKKP